MLSLPFSFILHSRFLLLRQRFGQNKENAYDNIMKRFLLVRFQFYFPFFCHALLPRRRKVQTGLVMHSEAWRRLLVSSASRVFVISRTPDWLARWRVAWGSRMLYLGARRYLFGYTAGYTCLAPVTSCLVVGMAVVIGLKSCVVVVLRFERCGRGRGGKEGRE